MADQDDIRHEQDDSADGMINNEIIEDLTTLFAVRTTINQESNILRQIFFRFKILEVIPDIRAMLVSPLLPGYIFIEAAQRLH